MKSFSLIALSKHKRQTTSFEMAITRASFAICLLLSLATIATADYYSPSSPHVSSPPAYKPTLPPPVYSAPIHKPTLPPPVYSMPTLPPPVYTKPTIPPPVYTKPTIPPPVYTKPTIPPPVYTKPTIPPPVYTKPTMPPPVYTKPTMPPPVYTKPTIPPPVYTKPTIPPPVYTPYVPKPTYTTPPKPYVPKITLAVDGYILCKNGYETYPILGAKAKIVCSEPGAYGKSKSDVVIYSNYTDSKGYFYVALTDYIKDLAFCRVSLYFSPVETCKEPTNVNKGYAGVNLSVYGYRYYVEKNLKISSVGPFYYTGPKPAPTPPKY